MHRSRVPLLVIVAVVAACSKRDNSDNTRILSQDSTLAARVENSQISDQQTATLPLPDACGAVETRDQPTRKDKLAAAGFVRQANEAEILGNMREAAELLRRATKLNWRDRASAYHLGRVDEALGDRPDAVKAYCRFLTLGPSAAEQREASQRVASLSQSQSQLAAAAHVAIDTAGKRRPTTVATAPSTSRNNAAVERVVAQGRGDESRSATSPKRRTKRSTSVAAGAIDLPTPKTPSRAPRTVVDTTETANSVVAAKDGGAIAPAPSVDPPKTASPVERRGPSSAQAAGIGAVAGAIIGGVTGRSIGAAAIGAAAGGILGATVVRQSHQPQPSSHF
jgi:hypothetical protein